MEQQRFTTPDRWLLSLILALYFLVGAAYTFVTPAWQAPDEPAHYNYVRQLAAGEFPIMATGDYNQTYQGTVISSRFDPRYSIADFEYQDYQPPLYYLLETPIFWASQGNLNALRFFSLLLGAGVVALCYLIGRILFPNGREIALTAALFIGLLPQHLAMLSSTNNDALAELLIALTLFYLLTNGIRRKPLLIGLLLGFAFLTKVTAYLLAGVIGVAWLWEVRQNSKDWLATGIKIALPALLIGTVWWGRNLLVYGNWDLLGTRTHDAVVVGQPTTSEWIGRYGLNNVLEQFWQTTFHSFWGQFGWMAAPFPQRFYQILALVTLSAVIGLGWQMVRIRPRLSRYLFPSLVLGTMFGLNLLLYLAYNLNYVQHQGRYFFASLLPISLAFSIGWTSWGIVLKRIRFGRYLLPLALACLLLALNFYALRFMLPCLAPNACG